MSIASALHDKAMECVDLAMSARRRGDDDEVRRLYREAFVHEIEGIEALEERERLEPWFSVLHRSAAWLALNGDLPREAEKIAAKALAQDPHPAIAEELHDVLDRVRFHRHLEVRGVMLGSNEMQMSLAGRDVGPGIINPRELANRVPYAAMFIQHTADLLSEKPLNKKTSTLLNNVYQSLGRAASYAVTLRLAPSAEQVDMPGIDVPNKVFDKVLNIVRMVDQSAEEDLQQEIKNPAYLVRFMSLAKKIAPDGESINQVGFTLPDGESAQFTRRSADVPLIPKTKETEKIGKKIALEGRLLFADATSDQKIKIIPSGAKKARIVTLDENMIDQVVTEHWNQQVHVEGVQEGNTIRLTNIWELDTPAAPPSPPPSSSHPQEMSLIPP